jgi:hypothetical protein
MDEMRRDGGTLAERVGLLSYFKDLPAVRQRRRAIKT